MPCGGEGAVRHQDTNIQLLLEKLPADSLALKLVAPFGQGALDDAVKAAQRVLDGVKAAHLAREPDGPVEAA